MANLQDKVVKHFSDTGTKKESICLLLPFTSKAGRYIPSHKRDLTQYAGGIWTGKVFYLNALDAQFEIYAAVIPPPRGRINPRMGIKK